MEGYNTFFVKPGSFTDTDFNIVSFDIFLRNILRTNVALVSHAL